jgi:hypothetical protein
MPPPKLLPLPQMSPMRKNWSGLAIMGMPTLKLVHLSKGWPRGVEGVGGAWLDLIQNEMSPWKPSALPRSG